MVNWYFVLAGGNCTSPATKAQLPNAIEREKRVWGLVVGIMSWADGALVMRPKLVGMVPSLG